MMTSKECQKKSSLPPTVASILKERSICNETGGSGGMDMLANSALSQSPHGSYHSKLSHKHPGRYYSSHSNDHKGLHGFAFNDFGDNSVDDSVAERFDKGHPVLKSHKEQMAASSRSRSRLV
jgi:hypothetical protein